MKMHCITCGKALPTDADAKAHQNETGHWGNSAAHRKKPRAKTGILYRAADKALVRATTGDKAYCYILHGYRPTTPYWAIRKHVLSYAIDDKLCTCRQWYAATGVRRPGVDSVLERSQLPDKRALRTKLEGAWERRARGMAYAGDSSGGAAKGNPAK